MSTDGNTDESRRPISRREFLVLGGGGAGALAFGGYAARMAMGQDTASFSYSGHDVLIKWRNGRPQLYIDGEPIVVVDTNDTYRAAGYAFDWASTPQGLAKKLIENFITLEG